MVGLFESRKVLLPFILMAILIVGAAGAPQIKIVKPEANATIAPGDVNVSVGVQDFSLVQKYGLANVAGEGHIHYFRDVAAPTAPGKIAVTANGTWFNTVNTSFIWKNVSAGMHNFSVELVNNDHTPLTPPVTDEVNVIVQGADPADGSQSVTLNIYAENIAFNTSTITAPAGADVTVNFDNRDSGVPHNIAFYETKAADKPIYVGEIITGPTTTTYNFKAPEKPGTYFFRCDIHPLTMYGDFVVT
ncbi:MAG TPA: cupredoxin domain-containing protein [Methanothrix sp.]|nr:cupredoxin domain-containing protein [Methanothrix sp.]